MEEITGVLNDYATPYSEFKNHIGEVITIKGAIHNIREMSDFAFILVRTARELVQCVYSPEFSDYRLNESVVDLIKRLTNRLRQKLRAKWLKAKRATARKDTSYRFTE